MAGSYLATRFPSGEHATVLPRLLVPSLADLPCDISVIIVAYNGWAYLHRCLSALAEAMVGLRAETIVVDNGSTDGTPERLEALYPDIALVPLAHNTGFAAANNRGILASRGRYVLLLNSDTEPEVGSITKLVHFLDRHSQVAVVAPRLLNTDGTEQHTARRFHRPLDAIFGRRSLATRFFPNNPVARRTLVSRAHPGDDPYEVDHVSGACLLARRAAIIRVGALDEEFFSIGKTAIGVSALRPTAGGYGAFRRRECFTMSIRAATVSPTG